MMPARRRISNAFSNVANTLSDLITMQIREGMMEERQAKNRAAMLDDEQIRGFQNEVRKLADPANVAAVGPQRSTDAYQQLLRRLPENLRSRAGEAPDFGALDTPTSLRLGEALGEIGQATTPEAVPQVAGLMSRRRLPTTKITDAKTTPGFGGFPLITDVTEGESPEMKAVTAEAERKRSDLMAGQPRKAVEDYSSGNRSVSYKTDRELAGMGPVQGERTTEQQAQREGVVSGAQAMARGRAEEQVAQETFGNVLKRKQAEYGAMTPMAVQRAAQEAAATSWARIPAELDIMKKKAEQDVLTSQDKVLAEQTVMRNTSIRGLLPTYNRYRELAVEVAASPVGAGSSAASGVVNSLSHVPWIGEFLASGLEASHGVAAEAIGNLVTDDPELGKKVAELNRITDTLAQGMANAVLGNRGQTTENDRRTAKNILASSFTDTKTLNDLLDITDRMFTMLPTVSARMLSQDPFTEPAKILEAVAAAAKQEAAGSPALQSAQEVLNAR